ncbi:MAG: hypothetical protein DWI21_05610 [Planctomycetota bacterium]|nr:MAG: hypothetical protein DWI21_05610 [Planctomycetota bacterium]GDY09484.1 methylamine utilization protein [Planctomycetia bacterium]
MKTNHFLWRATLVATLSACILPVASPIQAQTGGSLTGQFVLEGDVPAADETENVKESVCAKKVPTGELVINKDNKGIANVFVFIPAVKKPTVPPELAKSKDKEVLLDQKGCQFLPHAQVMRTDQVLLVRSMDNCGHNTHPHPIRNAPANFTVPANERTGLPWKVTVAENNPTQVKCDIHPWMTAYVLVLDHPYAAVTDKDGKFKIENLPAGELEFRYWHERVGYVTKIEKIVDGKPKIENTVKLAIAAGKTTDVGTIKIPVARFAKTN